MKKYIVWFTTTDGDNDKEWCYAENEDEAEWNIRNEHWNIDTVDMVCEEDS